MKHFSKRKYPGIQCLSMYAQKVWFQGQLSNKLHIDSYTDSLGLTFSGADPGGGGSGGSSEHPRHLRLHILCADLASSCFKAHV